METMLRDVVGATRVKPLGSGGGGCISSGQSFDTDKGKFYVKANGKSEARRMFDGEKASLDAILATRTVRCPKAIAVVDNAAGGAFLVMEHMDIRSLGKYSAALGEQLARLHLHNSKLHARAQEDGGRVGSSSTVEDEDSLQGYVSKFGFHITTCCGYLPQDNTWNDDWITFYAQQKLKHQLDMIEKTGGDREARELWSLLERKIPSLFKGLDDITPVLLHGDLWGGNAGQTDSEPIIFDAASFYGHHEFDLAIASMFGGFGQAFWKAYHQLIPRAPGFEDRHELYKLFHYLNHWNHFGTGYRSSSLSIMRHLTKG